MGVEKIFKYPHKKYQTKIYEGCTVRILRSLVRVDSFHSNQSCLLFTYKALILYKIY